MPELRNRSNSGSFTVLPLTEVYEIPLTIEEKENKITINYV